MFSVGSALGWAVHLVVAASYLFLYTAYDKTTKSLSRELLRTVLTCGKSVDHTLVEFNKLISLVGITLLLIALLLPASAAALQVELAWHAMLLLWVHSGYSLYKYYATTNIPSVTMLRTNDWALATQPTKERVVAVRTVSFVLGAAAQLMLSFALSAFGVLLSVGHFWTMEVDYKWKLLVRPWALLPFALTAALVLRLATGLW